MKQCTKCGEWKETKYFCKNKNKKDGLNIWCKECNTQNSKKWHENNKEKIREKYQHNKEKIRENQKIYYENNKNKIKKTVKEYREYNKEKIKEWNNNRKYYREWYQNNKKHIKETQREYINSPVLFHSNSKYREEIELYEEIKKSIDNYLMCKCAYCGEWFKPTYLQIKHRISAINGKLTKGSEYRLYCSQNCKDNCPIYKQVLHPKDHKPATSREVQPELRQIVFERDNYICQKCNTHRDELEVGIHCHHKEGILWEPLQSADIDMCITLCADCHKEVHKIDGCGYHEMRCA